MVLFSVYERMTRRSLNRAGHHSRWHDSSVGSIHFFDFQGEGSLPPLVLLHGIASSSLPYQALMSGLRPHMQRILAPDLPGHGISADPDQGLDPEVLFSGVRELLDEELSEPAIVFGNSLGGAVALRYGLEHPEKVCGLLLSSPAGAQMSEAEMAALADTFRFKDRGEARRFFERLHHQPPWFSRFLGKEVFRLFSRPSIQQFLDRVGPDHMFTSEQLQQLRVPTLLIWGASEQILPRTCLAWYREHLPADVRIREPEGFGHCPYLERPRDVVKQILEFAGSL